MAKKGKGTPNWVDKLLELRQEIGEEEYRNAWRRINKEKRGSAAWREAGEKIIGEYLKAKEEKSAIFRSRNYANVAEAKRAAEIFQSDFGGKIIRRNIKGQFSKRGTIFQVVKKK